MGQTLYTSLYIIFNRQVNAVIMFQYRIIFYTAFGHMDGKVTLWHKTAVTLREEKSPLHSLCLSN